MSLPEAMREIVKELDDLAGLTDLQSLCPFCGGRLQEHPSRAYDHHPECAWLSRQKIVAVLEAAERLAECLDSGSDGPWRMDGRAMRCWTCDVDLIKAHHATDCPWQMLVAALEDDVVPQKMSRTPS